MPARFAIIIPACDEEECIGEVVDELRSVLRGIDVRIAVGVNGSCDGTAEIARKAGVLVAETARPGYGIGCLAAIQVVNSIVPAVDAFVFVAADGANDPADIPALIAAYKSGTQFVLGCRTTRRENWRVMGLSHVIANSLLALWCSALCRHWFRDIGPLRVIDRDLFERIAPREHLYGWTIEGQIRAVQLGANVCEVPVRERARLRGRQKVSRVSWRHSLRIGAAIIAAGWRSSWSGRSGTLRVVAAAKRQFVS